MQIRTDQSRFNVRVSVAMLTYNHDKYITKALDSILMQKTNFDYEIVVGEDCSTDNTRNILIDYQNRYPDRFLLLLNENNLGMIKNGTQVLKACKGEYIAMLEGDDYWTSPEKLQKQVDFLDKHTECAVCFHDSLIIYEDGSQEPKPYRPSQKAITTVEDLLLDNFIPTASVMFRRGLFGRIPDWIMTLKMGDWPIHILNALHGTVCFINEPMSVYVVHCGGVWSTKNWQAHDPAMIEMFEALGKHLGSKYKRIINRILRWRCFSLSNQYEVIGDEVSAGQYACKSFYKHLQVLIEPLIYGNRIDSISDNTLTGNMKFIKTSLLLRNMLRLRVVPFLQSYFPPLYLLLRAIAHKLKIVL